MSKLPRQASPPFSSTLLNYANRGWPGVQQPSPRFWTVTYCTGGNDTFVRYLQREVADHKKELEQMMELRIRESRLQAEVQLRDERLQAAVQLRDERLQAAVQLRDKDLKLKDMQIDKLQKSHQEMTMRLFQVTYRIDARSALEFCRELAYEENMDIVHHLQKKVQGMPRDDCIWKAYLDTPEGATVAHCITARTRWKLKSIPSNLTRLYGLLSEVAHEDDLATLQTSIDSINVSKLQKMLYKENVNALKCLFKARNMRFN